MPTALESMETGLASCTGLSILLIDACRSVGVPARFVGTPLWADGSGNHSWVEIWDGGWHFVGAAEPAGLEGITARAVVVIDEKDKVVHSELVTEIEQMFGRSSGGLPVFDGYLGYPVMVGGVADADHRHVTQLPQNLIRVPI